MPCLQDTTRWHAKVRSMAHRDHIGRALRQDPEFTEHLTVAAQKDAKTYGST